MTRGFLIGLLCTALVVLAIMVFYAGLLTLTVQPGDVVSGGGFTVSRPAGEAQGSNLSTVLVFVSFVAGGIAAYGFEVRR